MFNDMKISKKYFLFLMLLFLRCVMVPQPEEKPMDFSKYGIINDDEFTPEIEPDFFIIYSESVPFEVPTFKDGDITGYSYLVAYNGEVTVIAYYHPSGFDIARIYFIDQNKITKLDSIFTKANFINYPAVLPRTNKIMRPTYGFSFGYRSNPKAKIKIVHVITTLSAKKYYPDDFFKLYKALKQTLSIH